MPESEATDRFVRKFGPVNAIRLLGYAYGMEFYGEDWLRENVSHQQLLHIRHQFEDAEVPWGQGAIQWPLVVRGLKRASDDAQARNQRAQERLRSLKSKRGPRTT